MIIVVIPDPGCLNVLVKVTAVVMGWFTAGAELPSVVPNRLKCVMCSYIIYKCGRGPYSANSWTAGCATLFQRVTQRNC